MDWRHQAACRDHDPELWFSGKPYEQAAALACDSEPIGLYEIERRLRTAGFKRPQAGSIMDAEQSDELAEAYEQGKQAVFDAMNHFDELAIVERANPYRKDGR